MLQTYFYTTWVRGVACQKTSEPKLAGDWAFWDPLHISATIEASNFKFCTQRGFGECITVTALVPNLVGAGWSKIVWTRYHVPGIM